MGKIIYKKMSLFDAPKGSALVHACNAQGVWGSGIAAEFKKLFPSSYKSYKEYCKNYTLAGGFDIAEENNYIILSLITSKNYGNKIDSSDEILVNTTLALNDLGDYLERCGYNHEREVYSNKFNSGLFNVPWEKTEVILKVFVKKYNLNWTVCDPNLQEK